MNMNPAHRAAPRLASRSEEHTSELQSLRHLVCRLLLEKKYNVGASRPPRSFFAPLLRFRSPRPVLGERCWATFSDSGWMNTLFSRLSTLNFFFKQTATAPTSTLSPNTALFD